MFMTLGEPKGWNEAQLDARCGRVEVYGYQCRGKVQQRVEVA
jgi:hypothetical protein